jgi:hypothetical protein
LELERFLSKAAAEIIAAANDPPANPSASVISLISPSVFTIFTPDGFAYAIYGSNFALNSSVLIQGTAVNTFYQSANEFTGETIDA